MAPPLPPLPPLSGFSRFGARAAAPSAPIRPSDADDPKDAPKPEPPPPPLASISAETGREAWGERGIAWEASHRSRSRASLANLDVSYVAFAVCSRATSARFSASMRSRSRRRCARLSELGSLAAPKLVGSAEIQWSMTGTWLAVSRTPPVQSRVPAVPARPRRRIFESLPSSTVFSSSISAKRSSWIWARLRLARTCG